MEYAAPLLSDSSVTADPYLAVHQPMHPINILMTFQDLGGLCQSQDALCGPIGGHEHLQCCGAWIEAGLPALGMPKSLGGRTGSPAILIGPHAAQVDKDRVEAHAHLHPKLL
jgi:hypothetical protein